MKKGSVLFLLVIVLLLNAGFVLAHEAEEDYGTVISAFYPFSTWAVTVYGSLAFGVLLIAIILFSKQMKNSAKKIVYFLVVIVVGFVTLYLVITTLHLNYISDTKGPVHWHADFEIWVCDEKLHLAKPKAMFSNKQGTNILHAHEDSRIHVEGVLLDKQQASLGSFFHSVGGSLSDDGIRVPTDEGLIVAHEGDNCNGSPGKLYVFVNGNLIDDAPAYVISPYEEVPPGDRIKFVFTEQAPENIKQDLG